MSPEGGGYAYCRRVQIPRWLSRDSRLDKWATSSHWRFGVAFAGVAGVVAIPFGLWDGYSLSYSIGGGAFIAVGILVITAIEQLVRRVRQSEP